MPAVSDSVEAAIVALETEAHNQRTLFSTDALRFLANSTAPAERSATLQAVIAKAKTAFPNEDGWLVINLTRLEEILAAK